MLLTAFDAVQSGLRVPVKWHRFSDDPFQGQVRRLAPVEDCALDRGRQERQLGSGANVGFCMPRRRSDFPQGFAASQLGRLGMRLG